MVFEDLKHLETLVVICRACILKEKPGVPAVLQSRTDLTLPELAGEGIGGVSDESRVGTGSGETGAAKPVEDEVARGKVVGGVLDHREGEAIDRKRDRAQRGHHQRRGGGNRDAPSSRGNVGNRRSGDRRAAPPERRILA